MAWVLVLLTPTEIWTHAQWKSAEWSRVSHSNLFPVATKQGRQSTWCTIWCKTVEDVEGKCRQQFGEQQTRQISYHLAVLIINALGLFNRKICEGKNKHVVTQENLCLKFYFYTQRTKKLSNSHIYFRHTFLRGESSQNRGILYLILLFSNQRKM